MIEMVKFDPQHWYDIQEQDAMAHLKPLIPYENVQAMAQSEHCYTLLDGDRILACGGIVEFWPGRGEAWAELAKVCRSEFLVIHNTVKRFLDVCPLVRIEISVDCEFTAGHRWARLLGFKMEAPRMRNYSPDGRDYSLYARVR